jgi:hypothetical protein
MNNILAITTKEQFLAHFNKETWEIDFAVKDAEYERNDFRKHCYFSFRIQKLLQQYFYKFGGNDPLVVFEFDMDDGDIISFLNGESIYNLYQVYRWFEINNVNLNERLI